MIVVDASVAVKWFLEEPASEAAGQFLEGKDGLTAPQLIRLQVAGAFTRRARTGQLEAADAQRLCARWFDELARGVLSLVDDAVLLPAAVVHALALRHPLQDCVYLALAEELGAPLVYLRTRARGTGSGRLADPTPGHLARRNQASWPPASARLCVGPPGRKGPNAPRQMVAGRGPPQSSRGAVRTEFQTIG